MMTFILCWILFCFSVSFIGIDKKVGYWGLFGWCILISPLGGIILGVRSPDIVFKYKKYIELGERSEFKGEIKESISHYMDVLFFLDNDENLVTKKEYLKLRQKLKEMYQTKIEELKNLL